MIASRQIAADMGLNMKIGDVEYQGDKIKAIFYYIADERVDFRELIKVFAERFHIRIEMKQIGARQEAGRIGGLGACGRELCCASWMSTFSSVTTGAARVQDISLNPQKLAGQCSKLKCCMMYEYDAYVDARKEFPRLREPLQTEEGEWFLVKSDVLAGTMTFSSSKETMSNLTTLPVSRVKEILALNRQGKKAERLQHADDIRPTEEEPTYRSEEDSITRFDQAKRRKRGGKNKNRNNPNGQNAGENTPNGQKEQETNPANGAASANDGHSAPRSENGRRNNRGNRGNRENRGNRQENQGGPGNRGDHQDNRESQDNREPRENGARPANGGDAANANANNNGNREGRREGGRNHRRNHRRGGQNGQNGGNGGNNGNGEANGSKTNGGGTAPVNSSNE